MVYLKILFFIFKYYKPIINLAYLNKQLTNYYFQIILNLGEILS